MKKTITVFKGDGIGPEITDAVLAILQAAQAPLAYEVYSVGIPLYEQCGELISEEAFASFERNKVLLKSPITRDRFAPESSVPTKATASRSKSPAVP